MNSNKHLDDLAQIRNIMERSTKFLSLSAWAAIMAGVYALIGSVIAYRIIYTSPTILYDDLVKEPLSPSTLPLIFLATLVFVLAAGTGIWFNSRKAQKAGKPLWDRTAIRVAINFIIPLAAGGVFVVILYYRGFYSLLAASTLIFYGLALLNAGNFTFSDVRSLGISELIVGILAAAFPGKGLLFWAIGFGLLHIIYGVIMWYKYERNL